VIAVGLPRPTPILKGVSSIFVGSNREVLSDGGSLADETGIEKPTSRWAH
jgi:hypothetical protein